MNLVILLAALVPWAASPTAAFTRIFLAVSVFSVEMQLVTLSGVGSLYTLPYANGVLALLLVGAQMAAAKRRPAAESSPWRELSLPWPALAAIATVVLLLNAWLPLQAADPYHLDRVATIERSGTLAYDPALDPKVNILGSVYELVLADLRRVPAIGAGLVKMHGLLGLLLYTLTISAVCAWLPSGRIRWPAIALFVVPAVFHQFVLIKNDLFLAAPALVALAWLVSRASAASWMDVAWAGWLIGIAIGSKPTNLALAIVAASGLIAAARSRKHLLLGGLAVGLGAGLLASGLPLKMWQNAQSYGDAFASGVVADMGNTTTSVADAATSVARFGLSLLDLGLVTPTWWPGRGGWGGTFGLTFIWAVVVLAVSWGRAREARWALMITSFQFLAFSAVFPDADLSHRLALPPALLSIAVAVHLVGRPGDFIVARRALVPIVALSGAQMLRSAVLYLSRA